MSGYDEALVAELGRVAFAAQQAWTFPGRPFGDMVEEAMVRAVLDRLAELGRLQEARPSMVVSCVEDGCDYEAKVYDSSALTEPIIEDRPRNPRL